MSDLDNEELKATRELNTKEIGKSSSIEYEKNIIALKQRAEEMLKNDYNRKIGDEEIYTIICEWKKTFDLYNKEKEKNKELYKDNQKQWEERCKLAIELDNNTISKDKMREKLQKLRKEYNKLVNKTNEQEIIEHLIDFNKCTAKIEIIRELLEE